MSYELLQRVKTHIVNDGGLLSDYTVRYGKWSDQDFKGNGKVVLFSMQGTSGETNSVVQYPDVMLTLLSAVRSSRATSQDMLAVVRYLRVNFSVSDVFNMFPQESVSGPITLTNGRSMFELIIRCGVEDH